MSKFIYFSLGILFFSFFYFILHKSILKNKKVNLYPYTFKIYYDQTNGVLKDDKVFVKGVPFGIVKSIDVISVKKLPLEQQLLYKNQQTIIEITIALKQPITIWKNYYISFHPDNTSLSRRMINIDIGNQSINEFLDKTEISKQTTIAKSLSLNADYYDNFSYTIAKVITENQSDVRKITNNINQLSKKLKSSKKGSLPRFLNSDQMYNLFVETAELAKITAKEARWSRESLRYAETSYPFGITSMLISKFILKKKGVFEQIFPKKSSR